MQQILIEFFAGVLKQDEDVLQRLSEFEGDMRLEEEGSVLIFRLSDIHQFLNNEINLSYPEFQRMIYQSNINEELFSYGGKIEVHQSTGKVQDSLYRLISIG